MKKLISLLAAISVVSACSIGAFAADFTVGNSTLTAADGSAQGTITESNGTYTATLNADSAAAKQGQKTILAVKGNAITVDSIEYIGQSADSAFTFALKSDELTDDVNVLIGGDSISPILLGTIAKPEDTTTFTVSGTVTGYYNKTKVMPTLTLTAANLKDSDGNALVYNVALNSDGTFSQVVKADTYKLYASKDYHTTYTVNALDVTTADVAYADPITVYVGNLDNNNIINVRDLNIYKKNFNKKSTDADWEEISYVSMDENNIINVRDLNLYKQNFNKKSITK